MKQKKVNRVALLLHWAGEQKAWLFLAVFLSAAGGLCIVVPYMGIYQLMDAAFSGTCTTELVVRIVAMIAVAVTLRFVLFGCSGVAAHKGAYGALFKASSSSPTTLNLFAAPAPGPCTLTRARCPMMSLLPWKPSRN